MRLSSFRVERAKPQEKPYKLSDGGGLCLLINPNGSKLWRFRYRFGGKQKMIGLGAFPEVSLATARDKREDARKTLASGMDPSQKRKADRRDAQITAANTFGVIADEYIAKCEAEGIAEQTGYKKRWLLLDLAKPLCPKPITEITAADILQLLKAIEKTGRRETALRLRAAIGAVFRYAIATLRAQADPTYALRGALAAPQVKHRAAITDEAQLGALWVSINEYDGWPTLKAALQLTCLTMCRPGEVRHMTKREISFLKAMWQIPAEKMKMKRDHIVPLSRQALTVLREVWEIFPESELVLPSIRSWKRPLSENAMNSALRRMGYAQDEQTAHGLRSTASTILNERGYNPDVIEAALAHQDEDEVRAAYNRAKYLTERTKLLQDWADLLDSLRTNASRNTATLSAS